MEENLQQLEATYGAPASLFERSAAARAQASGSTTEAVLAEWAGEGGSSVSSSSEGGGGGEATVGGAESPAAPVPGSDAAAGGLSGATLLAAVAEARGMPESLIERSASARASATGGSTDDVLRQWAEEEGLEVTASDGGGEASAATVPSPETEAAEPAAPVPGSDAAAGGLSGAALLAAVAEARRMPESLIERSASARADTAGVGLDDILRDWAEEEGLDVAIPPPEGEVSPSGDGVGEAPTAPVTSDRTEAAEPAAPVPGSGAAAGGLSGAALLAAVAEARGMPESLVERSAKARAKSEGGSVDDVLLEWAREEGLEVLDSSPSGGGGGGEAADGGGQASTAPVPSSGAAAGGLSGAALLAAVAEARGMPESLVERSAKARAKSEGGSVDDVLLEWAREEGLDVGGGDQASAPPVPIPDVPLVDQAEDLEEELVGASDADPAPKVDIPGPVEPEPIEESGPEVPASPRSRYPAWLAAVLIVIPLLAVLYVVVVPNQPTCGSAGQLAIDPATGNAVGCDGGEYGAGGVSNLAAGAAVYDAACAVCHGANGGGGAGPAMAGGAVLVAFPETACESQIEWIALGSADWPDATYGANNTPVAGGMPGFEGQLTELEIAQVTLYERVEFGGLEVEAAEAACGFGMDEG